LAGKNRKGWDGVISEFYCGRHWSQWARIELLSKDIMHHDLAYYNTIYAMTLQY
jgi:hypothetical protein